MIKALVVDDEKRVRKGFISLADWQAYDIQIVGEARDGNGALEALGKQDIDLMFVDISMPGMSGFELIEQVRVRHPRTRSVVLTCHHEFDYVQEALRLGAIDYIVKTLLNKSNVNETLQRIVKRFSWERREQAASDEQAGVFRSAAAFVSFRAEAKAEELLQWLAPGRKPARAFDRIWLLPLEERDAGDWLRELPAHLAEEWRAVRIVSAGRPSVKEAEAVIGRHLLSYLFYGQEREANVPVRLEDLQPVAEPSEQALNEAFDEWLELRWLVYGEEFKRLIRRIEEWRPDPERIRAFGRRLVADWAPYFGWEADRGARLEALSNMRSWKEGKSWLADAALGVSQRMAELGFSREVFASLVKSLLFMKSRACASLNQEEAARHAGMSRSYFSQCFKKFAGLPFGDVLRKLRLERAAELLRSSDLQVSVIANRIGFEDEKHFSRVFREHAGVYPTEYRAGRGAGGRDR